MKRVRIGLETRVLGGALTGVGNYTLRLLRSITATYPDVTYVGFDAHSWKVLDNHSLGPREGCDDVGHGSNEPTPMRTLLIKARSKLARLGYAQELYRSRFSRTIRHQSLDLFHAFNYLPAADPGVITLPVVYDLSFVRYPQFHPSDRLRILERLPQVLELAPRVQTISKFSKKEIARFYGYDEEKIFVAPPAAASLFRPLGFDWTARDIARYSLSPCNYLLSVGTLEPRKNLRTLISAYSLIPRFLRDRIPLVIVGGKGWGELGLPHVTNSLVNEGSLRFVGSVPNHDLRSLYEGAIALLYPSVYEGFGMPVVECMACGTQVVHSAGTSMDEITAGLALTIEATDVETWSKAIYELIESADSHEAEYREGLIARAAVFDWSSSAAIVRENYNALITYTS
jgi:glycosyltransferase involved in cell wall biosynthesis